MTESHLAEHPRAEQADKVSARATATSRQDRQFLPLSVSDGQFANGLIRLAPYVPEAAEDPDHAAGAPWQRAARFLFEHGTGTTSRFVPRTGVDVQLALRHIGAVQQTTRMSATHRIAAVAWLLAGWFVAVAIEGGPTVGGTGLPSDLLQSP